MYLHLCKYLREKTLSLQRQFLRGPQTSPPSLKLQCTTGYSCKIRRSCRQQTRSPSLGPWHAPLKSFLHEDIPRSDTYKLWTATVTAAVAISSSRLPSLYIMRLNCPPEADPELKHTALSRTRTSESCWEDSKKVSSFGPFFWYTLSAWGTRLRLLTEKSP